MRSKRREGTYYERRAIARDPDRASARAKSDSALSTKIDTAWQDNRKLYGARKIWHVLRREGEEVAPLSAFAKQIACRAMDAQWKD